MCAILNVEECAAALIECGKHGGVKQSYFNALFRDVLI